jgi:hypothetical protein
MINPKIHPPELVEAAFHEITPGNCFWSEASNKLAASCTDGDLEQTARRILREHIVALEQRVKELTEWRSMETAPRGTRMLCKTRYRSYSIQLFSQEEDITAYAGLTGWLLLPDIGKKEGTP